MKPKPDAGTQQVRSLLRVLVKSLLLNACILSTEKMGVSKVSG
jgi:hypothetical protein